MFVPQTTRLVFPDVTLTMPRYVVTWGTAMLFSQGEIAMRILSKRRLKELVLYSPQHVARLEKAGQFSKRVQLNPNRVGWVEAEVLEWLERRLAQRSNPTDAPV